MKTNLNSMDMDWMCSSSMRWLEGEEVVAYLDCDEQCYYLWIEPSSNFEDFCEEQGGDMLTMLSDLRQELAQLGVQKFYDLSSVNDYLESYCGDNEPSMFYLDETLGVVCGA